MKDISKIDVQKLIVNYFLCYRTSYMDKVDFKVG